MSLEQLYLDNENSLPLKTTIIAIHKILLLKNIFETVPNFSFKSKTELELDEYYDYEINVDIISSNENDEIKKIIDNLKINNSNFIKENIRIIKENDDPLDEDEVNDVVFELTKIFNNNDKEINKNNYKNFIQNELYSIVETSNCNQKENFKSFINDIILNTEKYTPKKLDLYGKIEINEIPINLEEVEDLIYNKNVSFLYKEEYLIETMIDFIKNSFISLYDKQDFLNLSSPKLLVEFYNDTFNLSIINSEKSVIEHSFSLTSPFFYFTESDINEEYQDIEDKTKIIIHSTLYFILNKIINDDMTDKTYIKTIENLKDIHTTNEKKIIESHINYELKPYNNDTKRL